MTVLGFAFDTASRAGAVGSLPRQLAQAVDLLREALGAAAVSRVKDYRLADFDGNCLPTEAFGCEFCWMI